jgi:hypothetical protein
MLKNFTMPEKFSYPKRPVTLTAEVIITGRRLTGNIARLRASIWSRDHTAAPLPSARLHG